MAGRNFLDNDRAQTYHAGCRKRGFVVSLSGALLTATLIALAGATPVFAGKVLDVQSTGYPGRGSYADWKRANKYAQEGSALLDKENFRGAIAKYDQAIKIFPLDEDWYLNIGLALRRTGDLRGAERAYKKAIKLAPNKWNIWSNLGNLYFIEERWVEAKQAMLKSLSLNPPSDWKQRIAKGVEKVDVKLAEYR